tara:strand:+ start:1253 stop:1720 length:468 start_codon:yes stop_codon:yes gene_type:complete
MSLQREAVSYLLEKDFLRIMKEEYDRKIIDFLFELQGKYKNPEGEEKDVLSNSLMAKVRHKETGFVFTVNRVEGDKIYLNFPDQPRFKISEKNRTLVFESENEDVQFNTSGELENKEEIGEESSSLEPVDTEESSRQENILVLDREEFEKEFEIQ